MPKHLELNKKYIFLSLILAIVGFIGVLTLPDFIYEFSSPLLGGLGLYLLIGKDQIEEILQPLKRPFFLKMLGFLFLTFIINIGIEGLGSLLGQFDFKTATGNNVAPTITEGNLWVRLIRLVELAMEMVGEEMIMAIVVLIIFYYLKKYKYGWFIASFLGAIVFGFMHLWAYNFQIWVVMGVGFSRIPFNMAWKSLDSWRAAIYLHLISDLVFIIPMALHG